MLNINFTGDISFTGVFSNKILSGIEIFDSDIRNYFLESDYNICNFEGAATKKNNILGREHDIKSPVNSIEYLKKRGFNIFNLANNHVFDSGAEGFLDTKKYILKHKCKFFGAGENIEEASKILYLEKNNIKIALIGVCHKEGMIASIKNAGIFCDNENNIIIDKIQEAKNNADWVVLNYHGGEEYTTIPMPIRRKKLKSFIKYGVDIIIACHSHVFQGYERVNRSIIFYSLGNFVFDIEGHKSIEFTDKSAILNIQFSQNDFKFDFLPTKIDRIKGFINNIPKKEFKNRLLKLTNYIIDKSYIAKWRKDAYRAFFQPNINVKKPFKLCLRSEKKLKLIFTLKAYLSLLRILKAANLRPIFLSALLFKIFKKLGFKNYT